MPWYELDIESRQKQATYQRNAELHQLKRSSRPPAGEGRSPSALTSRLAAAVATIGERTARRPLLRPAVGQ